MSTIGILDSGLGGLLILKHLIQQYPHQSYTFLADQFNAPYGSLNQKQLITILNKNVEWFQNQGIQEVVLACNTACCAALSQLQANYPRMNIIGIIDSTCQSVENKNYKKVLVLATPFTANSHIYLNTLKKIYPQWEIIEEGLVELAMMIENQTESSIMEAYLKTHLSPFQDVDAIILGCTHFPFVKAKIQQLIPVDIYDSNNVINHSQSTNFLEKGCIKIMTTLDETRLKKQMNQLLQLDYNVSKITI